MSKYKNSLGKDIDVKVQVFTRPNFRDGNHEMFLYVGRNILENIFDTKKIDKKTTVIKLYYPDTWANIPELQALMEYVFYFYPNLEKLEIVTHSVYIIQNVYEEHLEIHDDPTQFPANHNPLSRLAPLPEGFGGLHVNGVKVT